MHQYDLNSQLRYLLQVPYLILQSETLLICCGIENDRHNTQIKLTFSSCASKNSISSFSLKANGDGPILFPDIYILLVLICEDIMRHDRYSKGPALRSRDQLSGKLF